MNLDAYIPILIFAGLSLGLAIFFLTLSWIRSKSRPYGAKKVPYECGFDPLEHTVPLSHVNFYLMGLFFVILDVEVVFLFPWAVTLGDTGFFGFCIIFGFLVLLTIGFFYEWMKGALRWS